MGLLLEELPEIYAIVRLPAEAELPAWLGHGGLVSVTRTRDELSIICLESDLPADLDAERNLRCIRVEGTIEMTEVGVLESMAAPLAEAGVPILALSTFDTDHLLVRSERMVAAREALERAGHTLRLLED